MTGGRRPAASRNLLRCGLALVLVAAADFLLFDRPWGIALPLFLALLAGGIAAANRSRVPSFQALLPVVGLLPLVENVSPLSAGVGLTGCALFALASSQRLRRGVDAGARQLVGFALAMPFRLPADFVAWRRVRRRMGGKVRGAGRLLAWTLPLVLATVFAALFAIANPVVEYWLSLLDLRLLLDLLEFPRIAFWITVVAGVWAFLRPRTRMAFPAKRRATPPPPIASPLAASPSHALREQLFGKSAVLRTLAVLNGLFALQTLLDATFLWGGAALPDGLTYAGYAHRGAYPLVVTALLAAAIILLFMRPNSATAADRRIRMLVYLWTVQNIVLVLSAILRLDLYVGIYALTYWRVAAFLWMALVAVGLALILARIAAGRTNRWLVSANLVSLALMLYACCFVDFAGLIARFNGVHSRELGGQGLALDTGYLVSLGPHAIPTIDRILAEARPYDADARWLLGWRRHDLAVGLRERHADWRAWTLRDRRLLRYLDAHPVVPALVPAGPGAGDPRP